MRFGRVLLSFHHHPTVVAREFGEDRGVVDHAVSRHGVDAINDGIEEAFVLGFHFGHDGRADIFGVHMADPITIGARTNVLDLTMIHADTGMPNHIGRDVTIGHRCVLHGVSVGDGALIGMGAVLLGGSVVGAGALVAAGAVVRERFVVPPRTLVAGVPAKIVRELSPEEVAVFLHSAQDYVRKIRTYL